MVNILSRQLTLITGLIFISFQLNAANITATATVTANIVPIASLGLTAIDVLEKEINTHINERKTQTIANNVLIKTEFFKSKKSSKLKVETYHNSTVVYDISVSPFMPLTDNLSNKMEATRTFNNGGTLTDTSKQEYEVEVSLKDDVIQDSGLYTGIVRIVVNYN